MKRMKILHFFLPLFLPLLLLESSLCFPQNLPSHPPNDGAVQNQNPVKTKYLESATAAVSLQLNLERPGIVPHVSSGKIIIIIIRLSVILK